MNAHIILYLLEKFKGSFRHGSDYVEVFENPDRDEFTQVGPQIRFIISLEYKKIWVWNAYIAIHQQVADNLHLGLLSRYPYLLGEGIWNGRALIVKRMEAMEGIRNKSTLEDLQREYAWLTYFDVDFFSYTKTLERAMQFGSIGTGTEFHTTYDEPSEEELMSVLEMPRKKSRLLQFR